MADEANASLSVADAVKIPLTEEGDNTLEKAPVETPSEEVEDIATEDNEPDEIDEEVDQEADADLEETGDTDADDEEAGEEAEETKADEIIHTLRDGTQLTAVEVEDSYRREKDYHKKTATLAEERRDFETSTTSQQQEIDQTLDQLISDTSDMAAYLQRLIPAEPDVSLIQTDQAQYLIEQKNRNVAIQNLQQMQAGQQYAVEQKQLQNQQQLTQLTAVKDAKLVEMFPTLELDDPEKKATFEASMLKTAKTYGYTDTEYKTFLDPRGVKMARDAQKWLDHLAAQETVTKKVANAKPVTKPGQRRQKPNTVSRRQKKAVDRLKTTGALSDAMKIDFV